MLRVVENSLNLLQYQGPNKQPLPPIPPCLQQCPDHISRSIKTCILHQSNKTSSYALVCLVQLLVHVHRVEVGNTGPEEMMMLTGTFRQKVFAQHISARRTHRHMIKYNSLNLCSWGKVRPPRNFRVCTKRMTKLNMNAGSY